MTVNASGTPGHFITFTKGTDAGHNGKVIFDGSGTISMELKFQKEGLNYLDNFQICIFRNYIEAVRVLDVR